MDHSSAPLPSIDTLRAFDVRVLPSFATHFLMPHLANFFAAHPAIDLQLVAESRPADLHC